MDHKETSVLLVIVIVLLLVMLFYLRSIGEKMSPKKEIDPEIMMKLLQHDELINLY
jgi:hypothetical protein